MDKINKNFHKKILSNGMTVIFEQRKNTGVVAVAFGVKTGGVNEGEDEKGISHFIEHMLYKGTPTRNSKQISEEIEKNGGVLNGFTEEEMTVYWCKMPSDKLNIALDVLGDMVKNPLFDEKELEKERQVIFEEIKMRKDMPSYYVMDRIQSLLFTGNIGLDLIGNEKTLKNMTREVIVKKFKEKYKSSNMFLCVVGEANFEQLCDFCENNFEKQDFEKEIIKVGLKNEKKQEARVGIDQANLIFAYHAPLPNESGYYASQVLSCVLAGGMSSRLFQEIRENLNLAYAVKGGINSGKNYAFGYVFVGTKKENVEKVKELIIKGFEEIKDLGEKEFNDSKEQLIGNSKISREDSQGQMLDLIMHEISDSAEKSYEYEKKIAEVKLEDVKKLSKIKDYSFFALLPHG